MTRVTDGLGDRHDDRRAFGGCRRTRRLYRHNDQDCHEQRKGGQAENAHVSPRHPNAPFLTLPLDGHESEVNGPNPMAPPSGTFCNISTARSNSPRRITSRMTPPVPLVDLSRGCRERWFNSGGAYRPRGGKW